MSRTFVLTLYRLLLPIALVIGFPGFIVKGIRRGGLARGFAQRFGKFSDGDLPAGNARPLWIHAVSVGEVMLAQKLIAELQTRRELADTPLLLSTTTTTGYRVARENLPETVSIIHNPLDLGWIVRSVVQRIQPQALILIEAEIWPNLVTHLKSKGVPIFLINARLSPRSEKRYQKAKALIAPIFRLIDHATVPFSTDPERWASLGIPSDRIHCLGSIKFDAPRQEQQDTADLRGWLERTGGKTDEAWVIGGSTHAGEERLIADAVRDIADGSPARALIIPRHAERAPSIISELTAAGYQVHQRSNDTSHGDAHAPAVWLCDTTGELQRAYQLGTVAIIGKSFRAKGGQNPIEPLRAGCPIILGPHMQNFLEIVADLRQHKAVMQLSEEEDSDYAESLTRAIENLLTDPDFSATMLTNADQSLAQHLGATARNADFVIERLTAKSEST